jgi:hypothetical protein
MKLNRYERRHLLHTKDSHTVYGDNLGNEYDYKWIAQLSSFYNMFSGMLRNGFPIVVKHLWYSAWAFYPFFFVRADMNVPDPLVVLNHERIHVRQQRELHIVFSTPLILISFWQPLLWVIIPFIPTIFYYIDIIRVRVMFRKSLPPDQLKFSELRKHTCFEAEAISRSTNMEYLYERKFFAVIHFTGINFKKHGSTSNNDCK